MVRMGMVGVFGVTVMKPGFVDGCVIGSCPIISFSGLLQSIIRKNNDLNGFYILTYKNIYKRLL